jgi:hypothetical protein
VNGPYQPLSLPPKDGRVHWVSDLREFSTHYLSYGIFYDDVKDENSLLEVMENIFHDVEDADVYIDDFVLSPIPGMTIWHYCTPY